MKPRKEPDRQPPWFDLKEWVPVLIWLVGSAYVVAVLVFALLSIKAYGGAESTDLRLNAIVLAALLGFPFLFWRTKVSQSANLISDREANNALRKSSMEVVLESIKLLSAWREARTTNCKDVKSFNCLGAMRVLESVARSDVGYHPALMQILIGILPSSDEPKTKITIEPTFSINLSERPLPQDVRRCLMSIISLRSSDQIEAELDARFFFDFSYRELISLEVDEKIELDNPKFEGSILGKSVFSNIYFKEASFVDAVLFETDFKEAALIGADFSGSHLYACRFREAKMPSAKFAGAHLISVEKDSERSDFAVFFASADLSDADFERATADGVSFQRSTLHRAKFRDAELSGALFTRAKLRGAVFTDANLIGADFSGSTGITVEMMRDAKWDETTKFPDEIMRSLQQEVVEMESIDAGQR